MRKIAAMVIMIVMILPVLCVLPVNDVKAENVKAEVGSGGFVPVTLYFHNESDVLVLDTKAPETNNSTTKSLKEGAITFETDSLDKDLSVENQSFRVEFNFTVNVTRGDVGPYPHLDYVRVNLTIAVLGDSTECATAKYSGEKVYASTSPVSVSFSVDTTLCFTEGWDFEFDEDDEIRVRITPEIEEHDDDFLFPLSYIAYMEYDHEDKLGVLSNVYCAPVEIKLNTRDKDDNPKVEFMPNLAAEDCIIRFRGGIENAFGYEDITYVSIEVNGLNVHTPAENITGNKTKELLYEWDYSKYSTKFKANEPYTATITVETVQHTFTQTTNFTFSACGLEAWANKTFERVLVGKHADYTIGIRNTGSYDKPTTVKVTFDITVSPPFSHTWNVTLINPITHNTTIVEVFFSAGLECRISDFSGGDIVELSLIVASSNISEEEVEESRCKVDISVESVEYDESASPFGILTCLVSPYEIDLTWEKIYSDPYYALVNVEYEFSINVSNLGGNMDTVNLTINYTNPHNVWDITFENGLKTETVENLYPYGYDNSFSEIKFTVKASSSEPDKKYDTVINITGESVNAPLEYKEKFGNRTYKYLTLNLSRAFGISSLSITAQGPESVDVKNSSGQVIYEVKITTNDNTTHTVDLKAICDDKNITTSFSPVYVEVSKDSNKTSTLTVTCPKGMLADSYTITVKASIRGAPVSEHNKTANINVTVKEYYAISVVWADSNKNEITVTAKPGEYIHRTLNVKNEGNSKISVDLTPKATSSKYGLSITFSPSSQFDLSPKEEKNITLILGVPQDAKDGETLVGEIEATSPGLNKVATILIEIKQSEWEKLMATLYSMIYFIILLITVIVVFIAVWVKKKKMR